MKHLRWFVPAMVVLGAYAALRTRKRPANREIPKQVPPTAPRIVVLGGGFAGKATVEALASRVHQNARILLIDRHNYHLFTPMLYQATTCAVLPGDMAYLLRQSTGRHGMDFRRAEVRGVDCNQRRAILDEGEVEFDFLVVALGSTTSFFGSESARRHFLALKQLEDGIEIRNRVLDMLELAARPLMGHSAHRCLHS